MIQGHVLLALAILHVFGTMIGILPNSDILVGIFIAGANICYAIYFASKKLAADITISLARR